MCMKGRKMKWFWLFGCLVYFVFWVFAIIDGDEALRRDWFTYMFVYFTLYRIESHEEYHHQ